MSRLLRALAAAVIAMLFLPSMAAARDFYVAIGGGLGHTQPTFDGQPGEEDPSEHKTGFVGSAALGYVLSPALRADGELGYIRSPVKSDGGVALGGVVTSYLLMANLRHEGKLPESAFKYYVGAGVGGARVLHADEFNDAFTGEVFTAHQWRTAFAYQLRAGASYPVSPTVDLSVGYRYVHINHGAVEQFQGGSAKHVEFDVIQNHSLEIALAMKF